MTSNQPNRRRFLAYLATVAGMGGLGALSWVVRKQPVDTVAGTSTSSVGSTTLPPATPATSASSASPSATVSTSTTTSTIATTTTAATRTQISAICPDAWGALPVVGEFKTHTIERLTVHHTAVVLDGNRNAPARARQHQQYHQGRGWPDLAYHFLVDANGNVYEGRPVDAVGDTGTEYDPTSHFLVCCEGDFDQQLVTEAQLSSLIDMLAWAADEFGVSPDTIRGHRDWAATTCPGDDLYSYLESGVVAQAVRARLAEGGVTLARLCGDIASDLVADIEAGRA